MTIGFGHMMCPNAEEEFVPKNSSIYEIELSFYNIIKS